MNNNILVKLERYGTDYLRLKVYDRVHGSSGWGFLIDQEKLAKALNEQAESIIEQDGYNYLSMRKVDNVWVATLTVLEGDSDMLRGYRTTINIPEADFKLLLLKYETDIRWVHRPHNSASKIKYRGKLPAEILKNGIIRRAFVNGLKNSFRWGSASTINIYPEGDGSFFFAETINGKRALCGGLIRHTRRVRGKDGNAYEAVCYNVHT